MPCFLYFFATIRLLINSRLFLNDAESLFLFRFWMVKWRCWSQFISQSYSLGRLTIQLILNIPLLLLAMYSCIQLWCQSLCHGLIARMEPTQNFENLMAVFMNVMFLIVSFPAAPHLSWLLSWTEFSWLSCLLRNLKTRWILPGSTPNSWTKSLANEVCKFM